MTTSVINYSDWCSMLSTEGHHECGGCDCTCHEDGCFGGTNLTPRRPHSFPLEDWAHGRRPRGWREAQGVKRQRQRQEQLLGLV